MTPEQLEKGKKLLDQIKTLDLQIKKLENTDEYSISIHFFENNGAGMGYANNVSKEAFEEIRKMALDDLLLQRNSKVLELEKL